MVVRGHVQVLARHRRPYLVHLGPVLLELVTAAMTMMASGHIWQLGCWQQLLVAAVTSGSGVSVDRHLEPLSLLGGGGDFWREIRIGPGPAAVVTGAPRPAEPAADLGGGGGCGAAVLARAEVVVAP